MEAPREVTTEEDSVGCHEPQAGALLDTNTNARPRRPRVGDGEGKQGGGKGTVSRASTSLETQCNTHMKESSGTLAVPVGVAGSDPGSHVTGQPGMRRVKTINMGEIPLRPVGLSLSGSGMQLFVKVDNFLHEVQKDKLSYLENQFVAKICKAKKPAARRCSKKRKQSARKLPSPDSPGPEDSGVCVRPGDTPVASPSANCQVQDRVHPPSPPDACEAPVVDLAGSEPSDSRPPTTDRQVFDCHVCIKEEVLGDGSDVPDVGEVTCEDGRSAGPSSRTGSSAALNSPSRTHGRQPREVHTELVYDGNGTVKSSRPCKEGQEGRKTRAIQTCPARDWALVRPNPVVAMSVAMSRAQHKRPVPPVFTSSDLPLKRPSTVGSCSSADILLHQQRNNSSFFSPVRKEHAFRSPNVSIDRDARRPARQPSSDDRPSTDRDANMCADKVTDSEPSRYALMDTVSSRLAGPDDSSTVVNPDQISPEEQPSHAPPTDRSMDEDDVDDEDEEEEEREGAASVTPFPCPDLDRAQVLASGVVDAETLLKFTEYTRSMRRDLKQNYKRLSGLMKSFNQQLLQQSRHHSQMDDLDPSDDASTGPERRNGCLLM